MKQFFFNFMGTISYACSTLLLYFCACNSGYDIFGVAKENTLLVLFSGCYGALTYAFVVELFEYFVSKNGEK